MSPALVLTIYCVFVVAASLIGGRIPSLIRLTHTRIQLMMSCVGGLMLGIGLFHMLPHSINEHVSLDRAIWWMMAGLLTTFFLIRAFHSHQHGPAEAEQVDDEHKHDHAHDHDHHAAGHGHHEYPTSAKYRWVGIALGLSLHTLLDGAALAAGVLSDFEHSPNMKLFGFAVFLGVLLHKPLDSLSITSLMATSGWPVRTQQIVNFSYALMCPVGAAVFFVGVEKSPHQAVIIGCALAFAAGIFVCISLSDLLPELQFHSHDRLKLTASMIVGVALAYGIGYLEPDHAHAHSSHGGHDHGGHDHGDGHGHETGSSKDGHKHGVHEHDDHEHDHDD